MSFPHEPKGSPAGRRLLPSYPCGLCAYIKIRSKKVAASLIRQDNRVGNKLLTFSLALALIKNEK